MSGADEIWVERDGPLLTITIDRPRVLNALHPAGHRRIAEALDAYAADDNLRVAILTGAGDRAFCVGSDLKARAETNADDFPPTGFAGITHRSDLMKPVIAAVNGLALGGGVEIVAACDLAYAADHAEFGLPEVRIGLGAIGGGALQRLARQLPLKQAMEIALTGRRYTAAEATAMGWINGAVPGVELMAHVRAVAAMIVEGAPLSVAGAKEVMVKSLEMPSLEAALTARYPIMDRAFASEDAIEGQRAFAEKRKPVWKGR